MKPLVLMIGLFVSFASAKVQTIGFAAGCFWGVEKHFEQMPGVVDAVSGYAGGNYPDPSYKKVLSYRFDTPPGVVNYTETVRVRYDDSKISTEDLIKSFWELHDPTQKDRQGNDRGNNYRSAIFYTTPEQKTIAMRTKAAYQELLSKAGYGKIVTQILPLKKFYPAEAYHQDYLKKHPKGYCPNHATGVKFQNPKKMSGNKIDKVTPLGGKEILVIDAEGCPYCEKFKKEVIDGYRGSVPMRTAHEDRIGGFRLKGPVPGTPTILFIENGEEKARHVGYLDPKAFYRALGAFKLGKESEAYDVAFKKSTDARFCKKYEKFKKVGDGVFVDRISGEALFDTRDRFNSHSGWLSFFRPLPGSVVERPDNSFGMHRTEVLAKKSGAHLGHVFKDGPGGRDRYCINASVLDFVPRAEWKKRMKASAGPNGK